MKSIPFFVILFFLVQFGHAQTSRENEEVDTKYLEDQFYFGLGYNFLLNRPNNVEQRSLSYNLQTGFIKDLPLNARRNVALGIGFGYATNSYYTNVVATETDTDIVYTISDGTDFKRSKFETHAIEVPFELRWRTSTPTEYKFWRIYTGFKLAYVFARSSRFVSENGSQRLQNPDIQNLQYGLMLNFGFNTFNVHAYYSLNSLLKEDVLLSDGATPFDLKVLRIGVIFYIL